MLYLFEWIPSIFLFVSIIRYVKDSLYFYKFIVHKFKLPFKYRKYKETKKVMYPLFS